MSRRWKLSSILKSLLDRKPYRPVLELLLTYRAKAKGKDINKIVYDHGVWIHQTSRGCFAYHEPIVGLDMALIDELARFQFLWGYQPMHGDVVMDVGAGVGEETLIFSRDVGVNGKVVSVEAHPKTFRCLRKLVEHNRLDNVITVECAITEPFCATANIEDAAYLSNRLVGSTGISVTATTVDLLCADLCVSRLNFLKLNIEGAERFAIMGMTNALEHTDVVCISCHDFLADAGGAEALRTKGVVKEVLQQHGLRVVERKEPNLPPYVRDQVWAYNDPLIQDRFGRSQSRTGSVGPGGY